MYGHPPQVHDQSQNVLYNQSQPIYGQPMYGQPVYGQPMMQPMQPMQPMYMQTPGYSVQQSPIIIIKENKGPAGIYCQTCQQETSQIERSVIGCVAITWGVVYFLATGIFCFLPCIQKRYQDTEFVCVKCQTVKHTEPANCF